ncbi:photosynthetic complex assembly protein PuhC [Limimaricola pyoseonensis]|uniref:Putative photosynthetic complex assembly protein n=1 Tax=Limimaricola pyoseonensis TaxID=521013 RepID=A0A1G7B2P5_9RHOB|nr:photosynthetic complex assembly protein PuhC [Limimaricola pyoseonensis]SDE20515.1 putative photosynthetic complex assembly protein [Limimaricola pyoseonensis]
MDRIAAYSAHPARPDREMIPRALTRAMLALVLTVLALVSLSVWSGRAPEYAPAPEGIAASRVLLLSGDMTGAATVRDAGGRLIADLSPEEGGFVSGVWRVLQRQRALHRVPPDGPVSLMRDTAGRLSLLDPSTGWRAELMGFGADNARAFARLLDHE